MRRTTERAAGRENPRARRSYRAPVTSSYCAPCIADLALVREAVTSVAGTAACMAHAVLLTHSTDDPGRVRADRDAFAGLLDTVRRRPDPPRVVLLSSGGTVYDPTAPPPYRESSPTRPACAYGRAKLELEATLATVRRATRLPWPDLTRATLAELRFNSIARWVPAEEAATLRAAFEVEMARLYRLEDDLSAPS